MTPRAILLPALGCILVACQSQDDAFLPLPALCPERSQAICSARSFTCESADDDESCQRAELSACNTQRAAFEAEAGLRYDSVAASRTRNQEQSALDEGEAPFPLARFFEGGLDLEAECARDSQCASGVCGGESGICEDAPESALCASE